MLFLCLVLLIAPAFAAEPQLVWKGEVEGVVVLRIQKKQVAIDDSGGRVAGRPTFRFAHPLPEHRQMARVEVLEGRGSVQILEQPRADNNYSLAVSIEDRQSGRSPYSLALYWDADDGSEELNILKARRRESLSWKGRAEGDVIVTCRGDSCEAASAGGDPVPGGRARFTKPLPGRGIAVMLLEKSGRGDLRLLEQPSEENRYAARVLIRDPHAGSSEYSFKLAWLQPKEDALRAARPGLYWSGRVEGTARVTVHGRAASAAGSVTGSRARFERGLPGAAADVVLAKLRGRGTVRIVEQPASTNNWMLVFEIADSGPGPDDYELEVKW
jgi:ribosomal protein L35AE/L33A